MLYTEVQSPAMPGTWQQVCVVEVGVVCKPNLVFSFGQAEQQFLVSKAWLQENYYTS